MARVVTVGFRPIADFELCPKKSFNLTNCAKRNLRTTPHRIWSNYWQSDTSS